MENSLDPMSALPLTPAVFHILLALSEHERHGYGIMQEVAAMTGGTMRMGPGTLYGTLKRLLAAGLLEDAGERADPSLSEERRRYYRLTEPGEKALRAEARRLESLVGAARHKGLLSPPGAA